MMLISKARMWRAVQQLRPGMSREAFDLLWEFNARRRAAR